MIVDCHTHFQLPGDSGLAAAEESALTTGVDACILLALASDNNDQTNQALSEYTAKNPAAMAGFAVINPTIDNIAAKHWSALKAKGIKGAVLYCTTEGFHPTHSRAMRFYEVAAELSLPLFFHNAASLAAESVLEYARPLLLDEIARTWPELKIIIGSMGTPFLPETLYMLGKHENVCADLTIKPQKVWQIYNTVVSANEAGVMDKLLFGSGYPFGKAQECMETLLGFNKMLADTNLPTVPRQKIREIIERDTLQLLNITS